jgi:hypothetical protein
MSSEGMIDLAFVSATEELTSEMSVNFLPKLGWLCTIKF